MPDELSLRQTSSPYAGRALPMPDELSLCWVSSPYTRRALPTLDELSGRALPMPDELSLHWTSGTVKSAGVVDMCVYYWEGSLQSKGYSDLSAKVTPSVQLVKVEIRLLSPHWAK